MFNLVWHLGLRNRELPLGTGWNGHPSFAHTPAGQEGEHGSFCATLAGTQTGTALWEPGLQILQLRCSPETALPGVDPGEMKRPHGIPHMNDHTQLDSE